MADVHGVTENEFLSYHEPPFSIQKYKKYKEAWSSLGESGSSFLHRMIEIFSVEGCLERINSDNEIEKCVFYTLLMEISMTPALAREILNHPNCWKVIASVLAKSRDQMAYHNQFVTGFITSLCWNCKRHDVMAFVENDIFASINFDIIKRAGNPDVGVDLKVSQTRLLRHGSLGAARFYEWLHIFVEHLIAVTKCDPSVQQYFRQFDVFDVEIKVRERILCRTDDMKRIWYANQACAQCHKSDMKLKTCPRCGSITYCSKKCQKKHWKTHKKICRKMKKEKYHQTEV